MRPFSEHWPKPVLPVLGKPLMAYQLEMMQRLGIRRVVVVIGHLGHEVVRALGDGAASSACRSGTSNRRRCSASRTRVSRLETPSSTVRSSCSSATSSS